MGIINSSKSIGETTLINCRGVLEVRIGLTAAPDIVSDPTDIVLLLDRSGSMQGQSLADMKTGVNSFIDIIAAATGGGPDTIGSGSRIGIVSFASTATLNAPLTSSVADLKAATAALAAGGNTNHGDAFTEAINLLSASTNSKVIVMFTDGVTTVGPNPSPIAAAARAQGIEIYDIGLIGLSGIDVNALNDWATDPDFTHVAIAPDSSQLQQVFADLAANISVPGATDIIINEVLNPDFVITGLPSATIGSISQLTDTSFQWTIDQLGTTSTESAVVTFTIQHVADNGGTKNIDQSLTFTDAEGNVASFADPTVFVNCVPEDIRLAVTKSSDKTTVYAQNEAIAYTLVVSNNGNVPVSDIIAYDNIPAGLCYQAGSTRRNGSMPVDANPQSGIYIGTLNPNESATVSFILYNCSGPNGVTPITNFVNTGWATGTVNQTPVSAVSAPCVVTLYRYRYDQACVPTCVIHAIVLAARSPPAHPAMLCRVQ